MGCDIHIYLEKKENDRWVAIKGENPYYKDWKDEPEFSLDWFYNGRDYSLFALLADVRNDYNVEPLSEPKGVPEDVSDEIRKEYEFWEGDGHSHSWYTFDELVNFDYVNKKVHHEAYVSEAVYKQFKETGDPYPCCKGVGGGNVEKVLNCEMDRIIKNKYSWEKDREFYTAIRWETSYADTMEYFLNRVKDYIKKENVQNDELKNYRLVFWFDN